MTRYKIMKNMENEQEKEKIYFKLFYPLTIELWTLNFLICTNLYFTFTDYEFRECFSSFELLTLIFEV